mmetsp:Transcript_32854/g.72103  ORF Transcript_32854/g.72103 Transcript_32854/m.72103 type:complete len:206 (+) Transcript_32854:130-747(+)
MARAAAVVCGDRRRRKPVRRTARKRRAGSLDAAKVSARRALQIRWGRCLHFTVKFGIITAQLIFLAHQKVRDNFDDDGLLNPNLFGQYAMLSRMMFSVYLGRTINLEQLDMALYDIPPEERNEPIIWHRQEYRTIHELDDTRLCGRVTGYGASRYVIYGYGVFVPRCCRNPSSLFPIVLYPSTPSTDATLIPPTGPIDSFLIGVN